MEVTTAAPRARKHEPMSPHVRRGRVLAAATLLATVGLLLYAWWPTVEQIDSTAVLQFRNLSEDKEKFQYLVDGFSEELVVSLSQVPGLRFARGPADPGNLSPGEIADMLGVDAVVTGSLRTDGDKVRITAALVAKDGFQVWTNSIDGAAEDIFNFQERVATEVRDAILGKTGDTVRAASQPATPEAYDKYMRGLFFLAKRDLPSLKLARQLFEETIQLDSNFGPAYLRLAVTIVLYADYDPTHRQNLYSTALGIARQGAQVDPEIRKSIQLVDGIVLHQKGDWKSAGLAFDAAFNGPTPYPTAYHWHARFLGDIGLTQQALSQAIAARSLEPASQILNSRLAIAYLWSNDMAASQRYFDVANEMSVGAPDHHLAYALFLIRSGRLEEARATVQFAMRLANRDKQWVDPVIDSLSDPDDRVRREHAFAAINAVAADNSVPPYIPITLWMLLGETDQAMATALQHASKNGAIYELEIIYLDEFAEFRQHAHFQELLSMLGLTDYWQSIGCRWQADEVVCDGM